MTDDGKKPADATPTKPKRRGRRTKLTVEKVDSVCDFIRAGNYQKVAAALAGIKERTFYNWLERARDAKRPTAIQRHLLQSLALAEAQFEGLHVQRIFNSRDPRVSLEMLARRFPDRWSSTQKTEQRQVDKHGEDVAPSGVLVVPGQMDEKEWLEAAQRYKQVQPTVEEPADGDSVH
jgi:hypothetical protein